MKEWTLVTVLFFLLSVGLTWPVALHPTGGFHGFPNDNYGGAWISDYLHRTTTGEAEPGRTDDIQAPFGRKLEIVAAQPLDRYLALWFGGLGRGVFHYNLQVFLSFWLSGLTMYGLARYLTGNPRASFVAGVIFTASPFHLAEALQYHALATIQWLPLLGLAVLRLLRRRRVIDAVLTGATLALVWTASYYYGYFAVWFTGFLLVAAGGGAAYRALRDREIGTALRRTAAFVATRGTVAVLTFGVLMIPIAASLVSRVEGEGGGSYTRPLPEAVRYSMRPWMLVLPPHDNPLLGRFTSRFVIDHLYDNPVAEQSGYLGVVAVTLAIAGFVLARRVSTNSRHGTRALGVAGALALVVALGPYVPLDTTVTYWRDWSRAPAVPAVPSLGLLVFTLGPVFRFLARSFALASVALAALAAVGFAGLEIHVRGTGRRALMTVACVALILAEYTNMPPQRWHDLSTPPWVAHVRRVVPPSDSVVDYPLASVNSPRGLYFLFWQSAHDRATVNPAEDPPAVEFARRITDPENPESGRVLEEAGIDFAVVHTRLPRATTPPYQPEQLDDSLPADAGSRNPWFRLVSRGRDSVIYRIQRPTADVPLFGWGAGLTSPERTPEGTLQWVQSNEVEILAFNPGAATRATLDLVLTPFGRPRNFALTLAGSVLSDGQLESGARVRATFDLPPGTTSLVLHVSGPADVIGQVLGSADTRAVLARIDNATLETTPPS